MLYFPISHEKCEKYNVYIYSHGEVTHDVTAIHCRLTYSKSETWAQSEDHSWLYKMWEVILFNPFKPEFIAILDL